MSDMIRCCGYVILTMLELGTGRAEGFGGLTFLDGIFKAYLSSKITQTQLRLGRTILVDFHLFSHFTSLLSS
jgi:hypothetical protein